MPHCLQCLALQTSSQPVPLFVSPDRFSSTLSYSVAQSDTLSGIRATGKGSLIVFSVGSSYETPPCSGLLWIRQAHGASCQKQRSSREKLSCLEGSWKRADTSGASVVLSTGRRDGQGGYSVPSSRKLAFIKSEMFLSFVDLFTLAWLFVY